MKKIYLCFLVVFYVLSINTTCFGAIKTWAGGTSTDWNTGTNWSPAGVPGTGDDVRIGTSVFTNQPTLTGTTTVATLTFGTINGIILTVNGALTVTGTIIQNPNTIAGSITTTIQGTGSITGASMQVGNSTALAVLAVNQLTFVSTINSFQITGNFSVYSTNFGIITIGVAYNNAAFSLRGGTTTINGQILTQNTASGFLPGTPANPTFSVDVPTGSALNPILKLGGATAINSSSVAGSIDLYNNTGGTGTCTTEYSGAAAQTVYTADAALNTAPSLYQNLSFSGVGQKNVQAGTITLPGNWSSAGGKVDLLTNSTAMIFSGGAQTLSDAASDGGNGVVFGNVTFQGTGNKTISSSKFSVANSGILTMGGSATLVTGGFLTLISDATSSATVAVVPSGTAITGNVNVQRFTKGSPTDLSKRGYRLISSPVYTGLSPASVKCFDLSYLLNNAYISGPAGGGFNVPTTTNPTLYLYREDIAGNSTTFTTGNFKGVNKVNDVPVYKTGTQSRFNTANTADTSTYIPVGNGVLFFFRGDKTNNATQSGTKYTTPYDYPEDVTFTQTGQLNTGTVDVRLWFAQPPATPHLSYTNNASINNVTVRGYNLVGNPYASTINWEKFNRNATVANSTIYGAGFTVPATIWVYNPLNKQYETYVQKSGAITLADTTTTVNPNVLYTGAASNMIASGQGFFVRTTATGQTLSFREGAKTSTQPTSSKLIQLMSTPGAMAGITAGGAQQTTDPTPALRFRLIKDTINTDEVVLAFKDNATTKFSLNDDVEDLNGNGALVSLSLISSDDVGAAIKQVALPKSTQQVVTLAADATSTGLYQIKLEQIADMPAKYEVWLKDAFTSDSLDIRNNNTYNFNIYKDKPASFGKGRFQIIIRENPVLAMHALGFNAVKTTSGSQLTWITENELDNYYFTVLKSINEGKSFDQLGNMQSSGIGTYNYLDNNPIKGKNQYKVKVENIKTKEFTYTSTITLQYTDTVDRANEIAVYPNPAVNVVNIKMPESTDNSNLYTIKILNSSGSVVKQVTTAQPSWQENVGNLLPGTYIVQVVNNRENKIQRKGKFIKL